MKSKYLFYSKTWHALAFGAFAALLMPVCAIIAGCAHNPLTIAPVPPHAHTVTDWAKQNIVDADAKGQIVRADWVRVYHDLLKAYGDKLPIARRPASPDQGIAQLGPDLYHVDWSVKDRFILLKSFDNP